MIAKNELIAQNELVARRVVIKIGSSTLTDTDGKMDTAYIEGLAQQVRNLLDRGVQVLIVSSAAIVAGLEALKLPPARPKSIPLLQAAASVGQIELMKSYYRAFSANDIQIGQVLLTRNDTSNRHSYLHARDTLEKLLELGVVPLINENDTVAVDEIRFGDNDRLAAQVAILVKADLVILLSDIEGLYTADPRIDEDAQLLQSVGSFTEEIVSSAGDAGSDRGSGGMVTKIEAARMLMAAGIPMVICEGHGANVICDVACGKSIGTRFAATTGKGQAHARKLWMALSGAVKGSVTVDDGAVTALRENGGSLLPVGVIGLKGKFVKGEAIDIRTRGGFLIGRGLSNYASEELKLAAGKKSYELTDDDCIGHLANIEVIHRDQMVIF